MTRIDQPCDECGRRVVGGRIGPPEYQALPVLCRACGPRCEQCGHYEHYAGDCMWDGCEVGEQGER